MNKITILCILVFCSIAASQRGVDLSPVSIIPGGDYGRRWPPRPWTRPPRPSGFCYDHRGNRVYPGQSYYDGCNWCRCSGNGLSACTRRACPPGGWPLNPRQGRQW